MLEHDEELEEAKEEERLLVELVQKKRMEGKRLVMEAPQTLTQPVLNFHRLFERVEGNRAQMCIHVDAKLGIERIEWAKRDEKLQAWVASISFMDLFLVAADLWMEKIILRVPVWRTCRRSDVQKLCHRTLRIQNTMLGCDDLDKTAYLLGDLDPLPRRSRYQVKVWAEKVEKDVFTLSLTLPEQLRAGFSTDTIEQHCTIHYDELRNQVLALLTIILPLDLRSLVLDALGFPSPLSCPG